MLDVIIVGGGPLGLYAAEKLEENHLSYLLFEASSELGGQTERLYPEKMIVDIPNHDPIKAIDYINELTKKIDLKNVRLESPVNDIKENNGCVNVLSLGKSYEAKALIIATGLGFSKPRPLGVTNEEKYSNILYSLKDFSFLKDKKVVIFGGGDSALDWAREISAISSSVSLVHRRTEFRGNPDTIKGCQVSLYLPYVPHSLIEKDGACLGVEIEEVNTHEIISLDADNILVNYGSIPAPSLFDLTTSSEGFGATVNEVNQAKERIYVVGDAAFVNNKAKRIAPGQKDVERVISSILANCR